MKIKYFFLAFIALFIQNCWAQSITIIGCGYLGLTMAAVLAEAEHEIICVDINKEKILQLNKKQLYFYEPHLNELLFSSSYSRNLKFVDSLDQAMNSDIFYICVETPEDATGNCDCSFLNAAFNEVIYLTHVFQDVVKRCTKMRSKSKIICIKSTVPPGTVRKLIQRLTDEQKNKISVVYNPEFLREGSAINDIYNNPIILGSESIKAISSIENLYKKNVSGKVKVIRTNYETAELLKYAWNSFSALRITYVNELAELAAILHADISAIVQGIAYSEQLLPTEALKPGPGYGGSCLPKDTSAFSRVFEKNGLVSSLVHQVIMSNKLHQERLIQNIFSLLEEENNDPIVSILGLSFKANTDDIRNSPAIPIIKALSNRGITVQVYDPLAANNMKKLFPFLTYCDSPYEAAANADCIIVLTEWDEIKNLDLEKMGLLCRKKILLDTRNLFNPAIVKENGYKYFNMGLIEPIEEIE